MEQHAGLYEEIQLLEAFACPPHNSKPDVPNFPARACTQSMKLGCLGSEGANKSRGVAAAVQMKAEDEEVTSRAHGEARARLFK